MLQEQMSGELSPGRRSPTAMSEPEEVVEDHADVLNSMSSLKHAAELLYELYMKTGDDRFFFARTPQRCESDDKSKIVTCPGSFAGTCHAYNVTK